MQLSKIGAILLGISIIVACDKGDDYNYVKPGEYLPAYPGSYWDYSDGSRVRATDYELHSYRISTTSPDNSESCYVPVWDGKYLYKYSVYQQSTIYPMRKLLVGSGTSTWIVEENNNVKLKRHEIHLDSLEMPTLDTVFYDVCQVTEYQEIFDFTDHWNLREYYAKNVGLLRVEVNNPYDTLDFVVQKELRAFYINN